MWCADPWLISAAVSCTVTRRFSLTVASTAAMSSGVTTGRAWPGRGETVTVLMPFMKFLVHSYTCCSDRHASPYWTFIRRWISMGCTPSLIKRLKKTDDRTLFFFGACCKRGRHFYTTTAPSCCISVSYYPLSATLQIMSVIVFSLQDNQAVFRIFIAILRFFIWLSLVNYWYVNSTHKFSEHVISQNQISVL